MQELQVHTDILMWMLNNRSKAGCGVGEGGEWGVDSAGDNDRVKERIAVVQTEA